MSRILPRTLLLATALGASLATTAQAATLLHAYSFDRGASDSVGGADGALLNGATVTGSALVLDGVNDFVQFDQHLVPTSGSYAVSLFFRQASAQSIHVEYISQGATGGPGFYLGQNPSRQFRASDSWVSTGIALPSIDAWHHLVFSADADADQSTLYLDGIEIANRGFAISTTTSGTATRLGAQFQDFGEFFHGSLDEIMIFDGALGPGEIATLASAAPGTSPVPLPGSGGLLAPALLLLTRRRPVTRR